MAIEITSESIVKVLIRRGTDSERQLTTLTEGELGYSIDTQRLFIGDGITAGGVVAGNKFFGKVGTPSSYNSIAQNGDMVYQTSGLADAQRLVAYSNGTWIDVHPQPYRGFITNNIACLEKSSQDGKWRVARPFVDSSDDGISPPSGLTLRYEDYFGPGTLNSITQLYNRLDFDSRFLSLSASMSPLSGSFYFGNYNTKAVSNNLEASVNVDNSLYINGNVPGAPYQIKIFAQDPRKSTVSTFEALSGGLDIRCSGSNNSQNTLPLSLSIGKNAGYQLQYNQAINTLQTVFSAAPGRGGYGIPNFDFRGVTRFSDDVFLTPNSDLTIYGNLSVFGDSTYIDTTITTTSALSVINHNNNVVALLVEQLNNFAFDDQAIAIFKIGSAPTRPNLTLRDSAYVGINSLETENWSNNGQINFNVTGSSVFRDHPDYPGTGTTFNVLNDNIILGNASNQSYSTITGYANRMDLYATGGLSVYGGDIVAFAASDLTLKTNIEPIQNSLDKVNKLNGVLFDWNEKAEEKYGKVGREAGVIAQEVEAVLPEVVTTREDGTKAVRYEKLVPLLIEAIKELNRKVEAQNG
jgi:hypothetical protein